MREKRKVLIIVFCCCLSLFFMATTSRYFDITYFRWLNGYAIDISMRNKIDEERAGMIYPVYDRYVDVTLRIYQGSLQWFINYPCYTRDLTLHVNDERQLSNWNLLEITDEKIKLENNNYFEYSHYCGR